MKRIKMMCFLLALLGLLSACSAHSVDAEEQSAPTWQSRYDLGVRYLSDGRYEEAILAFTAAIEIDPKNAQAYEQRGISAVSVNREVQCLCRTNPPSCRIPWNCPKSLLSHTDQIQND